MVGQIFCSTLVLGAYSINLTLHVATVTEDDFEMQSKQNQLTLHICQLPHFLKSKALFN